MTDSRLGRFLTVLLVFALLAGGMKPLDVRAHHEPDGPQAIVSYGSAHDHAHGHDHDHDHDHDADTVADAAIGHQHEHNPFDHTHDIPTAAVEALAFVAPPRGHRPHRPDASLIPGSTAAPERPPRAGPG